MSNSGFNCSNPPRSISRDFQLYFRVSLHCYSVFDVGGQRGERRRWIQVFETITAILFVVDCSCFDAALREDATRNRLVEAVATFEQTWNTKYVLVHFKNKVRVYSIKPLMRTYCTCMHMNVLGG